MLDEIDMQLRVGKVTASNLFRIFGNKARKTYAEELRDQLEHPERWYGRHDPPLERQPAPLAWGNTYEPVARAEYAFRNQCDVANVRFRVSDTLPFFGASIDGIREPARKRGLEVKCCYLETEHLKTLRDGIPKKHRVQIYGELHCHVLEVVDFIAYDPRRNSPEDYREWPVYPQNAVTAVLLAEIDRFWDYVTGRGRDAVNQDVADNLPNLF